MTGTIVGLSAAYGLLGAMAVGLLLMTQAPSILRIGLAIAVAGLMFVTYRGISDIRGLPTDTAPPERFRLLWGQVVEPNAMAGEPGSVFLWIVQLDADWYPVGQPRAHRLPYSPELAALVDTALSAVADGEKIAGEISAEAPRTDTADQLALELEAAAEAGSGTGTAVGDRVLGFDFGDLSFRQAQAPVQPEKR
jgi:hypothetical protein